MHLKEHNNISNIDKSIITSSKDNESMCKQVLWLAPAPPACTPSHHNHNVINNYKQKSSSLSIQAKTTLRHALMNPSSVALTFLGIDFVRLWYSDRPILKGAFTSIQPQYRHRIIMEAHKFFHVR